MWSQVVRGAWVVIIRELRRIICCGRFLSVDPLGRRLALIGARAWGCGFLRDLFCAEKIVHLVVIVAGAWVRASWYRSEASILRDRREALMKVCRRGDREWS